MVAAAGWGFGFQGCGLGCLKGAPGFWACVPRERRGEIPGGDRGASVACARRGERDDPDAWARPGSETGRALCGREALAGLRVRERVGPRGSGPRGQAGRPERGEGVGLRDGPLRRLGQAGSGLGFILGLVFLVLGWAGFLFYLFSYSN